MIIRSYWPGLVLAAILAVGAVAYHAGQKRAYESGFAAALAETQQRNHPAETREPPLASRVTDMKSDNPLAIKNAVCPMCGGWGKLIDDKTKKEVPCDACHGTGKSPVEIPESLEPMPVLRVLRKYSKVMLKHMLKGTQPTDDEVLGFVGAVQAANSVPDIDGK